MDRMDQISGIIREHDDDSRIIRSRAISDGDTGPLFGRLERAALNQIDESGSMFSRYGIWANTVRDGLVDALVDIDEGSSAAVKTITRCINTLSAFAEIQGLFDKNE